ALAREEGGARDVGAVGRRRRRHLGRHDHRRARVRHFDAAPVAHHDVEPGRPRHAPHQRAHAIPDGEDGGERGYGREEALHYGDGVPLSCSTTPPSAPGLSASTTRWYLPAAMPVRLIAPVDCVSEAVHTSCGPMVQAAMSLTFWKTPKSWLPTCAHSIFTLALDGTV